MAAHRKPSRSDQSSIRYKPTKPAVSSFDLGDFGHGEYISILSDTCKQGNRKSESKSSKIMNTAKFVSTVGHAWDCVSHPLSVHQDKANVKFSNRKHQKETILCYSGGEKCSKESSSTDIECTHVDLKSIGSFSYMIDSDLAFLKVGQKISFFEPFTEHGRCSFWRYLQDNANMPEGSWKERGLASVRISCDLGNLYGWINEKPFPRLKYHVNITQTENKQPCDNRVLGDTSNPENDTAKGGAGCSSYVTKRKDPSTSETAHLMGDVQTSVTSLHSEYALRTCKNMGEDGCVSRTSSSLYSDYHCDLLASGGCEVDKFKEKIEDNMLENPKGEHKEVISENESKMEFPSLPQEKSQYCLAKQQHAFAGALAGTFVSLCLHPIDTIKTVSQSRCADLKSIHHISRSIISERGVTGLYRGISSNIASSAPISAVYTFTYESVKGALLPLLPKGYQSFAHCAAGGCASIATSFIFTPSERVKQQMQIGSHYQNCWNALIGIIGRGGLSSLYTGWGAVLCRNVPHSIIKFYTYESLKQLFSSAQSCSHLSIIQTLLCGGLAGSTAAFFTTPFDVVKTRLQTQIPGSLKQYDGVFNALREIAKHEGLRGLYRGLTPRLLIYISQGSLFFASYEFFQKFIFFGGTTIVCPSLSEETELQT